MHLDQTAMCPKHGIGHGVCVDPIRTDIPPEGSHPVETKPDVEASPGEKAWAGRTERQDLHDALDERYPMIEDFRAFAAEYLHVEDPVETEMTVTSCTAPSRCVIHNPTRFDPYEALDAILGILKEKGGDPIPWVVAASIEGQVEHLRAYITGIEK